jgi:hypothetical protein
VDSRAFDTQMEWSFMLMQLDMPSARVSG